MTRGQGRQGGTQELNKEKTQKEEVQSEPVPTLQQPLTKREQFGEV